MNEFHHWNTFILYTQSYEGCVPRNSPPYTAYTSNLFWNHARLIVAQKNQSTACCWALISPLGSPFAHSHYHNVMTEPVISGNHTSSVEIYSMALAEFVFPFLSLFLVLVLKLCIDEETDPFSPSKF